VILLYPGPAPCPQIDNSSGILSAIATKTPSRYQQNSGFRRTLALLLLFRTTLRTTIVAACAELPNLILRHFKRLLAHH
jgi:hypothetical protein